MGICQFFEEVDTYTIGYLQALPDDVIIIFISKFLEVNHKTCYDYDVRCSQLHPYEEKEIKYAPKKSKEGKRAIEVLRDAIEAAANDPDVVNMECKTGGKKEYCRISRYWNIVRISYGEIGTENPETPYKQASLDEAEIFMEKKIAEKKNEGYKLVLKPNPNQDFMDQIDEYIRKNHFAASQDTKEEENEIDEEASQKTRKVEASENDNKCSSYPFFPLDKAAPILPLIFERLGDDLVSAFAVCKEWNKVLADDAIWKLAYMNRWPEVHPERIKAMQALNVSWKTHIIKQREFSAFLDNATVGYVDKAGDDIEYLVARANNLHDPSDLYPQFPLNKYLEVIMVGDNVCYGPAMYISPENTKKLHSLIKNISQEKLLSKFKPDDKGFPQVLGGFECTADDEEYIGLNYCNFRSVVENAARRGNGLLRHMW